MPVLRLEVERGHRRKGTEQRKILFFPLYLSSLRYYTILTRRQRVTGEKAMEQMKSGLEGHRRTGGTVPGW